MGEKKKTVVVIPSEEWQALHAQLGKLKSFEEGFRNIELENMQLRRQDADRADRLAELGAQVNDLRLQRTLLREEVTAVANSAKYWRDRVHAIRTTLTQAAIKRAVYDKPFHILREARMAAGGRADAIDKATLDRLIRANPDVTITQMARVADEFNVKITFDLVEKK